MLRSAAISIIQRGLGFRSDLSDEIVSALQEAQRLFELGRSLPRFLKQEDVSLTIPAGSADVALPTGFIREVGEEALHIRDAATNERAYIEKFLDLNRLRRTLDLTDSTAGQPKGYYLRKASIVFLPSRDIEYTATWSWYKAAQILSTDVENEWLANAPDALIGSAGMILCADIGTDDQAIAQRFVRFKERYERGWSAMFTDDVVREQENYPQAMGSRL